MTAGEFVKLSYGLAVVIMLQTDLLRLPGFLVLDGKAQLQGRVYLVPASSSSFSLAGR